MTPFSISNKINTAHNKQAVLVVKKSSANTGNIRDAGLIPGSGRSPGKENGKTHSSVLAWRIPWTEVPGGLQSLGLQRVTPTEAT